MPPQTAASIDPAARIDTAAVIADDAVVEADAIIGPGVTIGPATRVRTRAIIVENTTIGARNDIHPYAIIGGDPQDRAYDPDKNRGSLVIGDDNVIREFVTIGRSTGDGPTTRIGSHCFLMSQSHVGHNAQLADHVVLANGASVAGYARVGPRTVLSGFCMIHQFCDVGEMVMFRAAASTSMHVPPFVILARPNIIAGLNAVGLRRAGFSDDERAQVKEIYRAVYRTRGGRPLDEAVAQFEQRDDWTPPAQRFIDFFRDRLAAPPPRNRGFVGAAHAQPHAEA